jgi:CDP-diacylglycerol pyrophosphatase
MRLRRPRRIPFVAVTAFEFQSFTPRFAGLRKAWKLPRAVIVLCLAIAFAFAAMAAGPEVGRGALWKVVQTCVANHALTGAAFPCLEVNVSSGDERGYVILRAPLGPPDLILAPTRKSVGVEDPSLQALEAPNYFEDALNARIFLADGRQKPLARDDVGLAVNSRRRRTQDQLHIHIGCLSSDMKQALQALAPELPEDRWVRIGRPMKIGNMLYGPGLWGRRVDKETLAGVNPFRLAAEGSFDETETRARLTIAVAGVQLARGRGGFMLLASQDDPSHPNEQFSAEDFLDPSCSL